VTTRGKLPGRVKAPEDKRCVGRPMKMPPPDALEVIRATTSTGATKRGVAMALGVNLDVLARWLAEHPELAEAFAEGRETERRVLHARLFELATKGEGRDSLIAAMFLLKSRHGYVEGEKDAQTNRVSINFQLPGAQPLNTLVIDNDADRIHRLPAAPAESARRG